jgi:hypothetical protein
MYAVAMYVKDGQDGCRSRILTKKITLGPVNPG